MRYDHFGDMGHPIDRMSHKHNLTVPGIVGYRPQKSGGNSEHFNPNADDDLAASHSVDSNSYYNLANLIQR